MPDVDARIRPTGSPREAGLSRGALTECVQAAIAAPSIHNSQPWRFRIRDGGVDVLADRRRRLEIIDPSGWELLISLGAAVLNVQVEMRRLGRVPLLRLLPEPTEPDFVARVTPGPPADPTPALQALAAAIPRRHTNRRPFARVVIPASVLDELAAAAAAEDATLTVADAVGRGAILSLARTAEQRLRSRGVYHAELAQWTMPAHGRLDGVPPQAFGPWDALEALPLRDFGLTQPRLHRRVEQFEPFPTIAVLSTDGDTALRWLRAGLAMQRVLLVATVHNVAATPISQPLEIPALRRLLSDPGAGRWAQVILRLGYGQPTTPTPRRPVAEVLVTDSPQSTG